MELSSVKTRGRTVSPKVRVALSVSDRWARGSAAKAIRMFGGTPIRLTSISDIPAVADVCVGAVCDLASCNAEALDLFRAVRRAVPLEPFVLYVPEENAAAATALKVEDPSLRYCLQDTSPDALAGLKSALEWLIESGASSALIAIMLDGRKPPNPTSMQFLQWAVRAIGTRCGHPVADGAEVLGVAPRTLARRLNDAHWPPPVEMYGWVKLLAVAWRADKSHAPLGRSARIFHLDAVRLYQLKRRLLRESQIAAVRSSHEVLPVMLEAFHERCQAIEETNRRARD